MMTPCTSVRFQYSRHHAMSYRTGSRSVMLVCPQRSTRRNQGTPPLSEPFPGPFWGLCAETAAEPAKPVSIKLRRVSMSKLYFSYELLTTRVDRAASGAGRGGFCANTAGGLVAVEDLPQQP